MMEEVSIIGIPAIISSGKNTNLLVELSQIMLIIIPREKPSKVLPQSPRKVFAGFKLKIRNPKEAQIINEAPKSVTCCFANNEIAIRPNEIKTAIPEARPSIPSIRLNEFVYPRIKMKIMKKYTIENEFCKVNRPTTAKTTLIICSINLKFAFKFFTSSRTPNKKIPDTLKIISNFVSILR